MALVVRRGGVDSGVHDAWTRVRLAESREDLWTNVVSVHTISSSDTRALWVTLSPSTLDSCGQSLDPVVHLPVFPHEFGNLFHSMKDGGVVAPPKPLADLGKTRVRVFPGKIHGEVTSVHDLARALVASDLGH